MIKKLRYFKWYERALIPILLPICVFIFTLFLMIVLPIFGVIGAIYIAWRGYYDADESKVEKLNMSDDHIREMYQALVEALDLAERLDNLIIMRPELKALFTRSRTTQQSFKRLYKL